MNDGRLQIYHSANGIITPHYQGRVLSVETKSMTTKIGWGGVFYIELNHQ